MFDHNQMAELAALKAERYQRAGGGGGFKVATSTKAYYDARGVNEMSAFRRAAFEARERFKIACDYARADFRFAPVAFDLAKEQTREANAYALATIPF